MKSFLFRRSIKAMLVIGALLVIQSASFGQWQTDTNYVFLDSTNINKNVGIGTVTPWEKLMIYGSGSNIRMGGGSYGMRMGWQDNMGGDHLFHIDTLHNNTWTNNRFVVHANTGNVGIGTATPWEKLMIEGSGSNIRMGGASYGMRMGWQDNLGGEHFFHIDGLHENSWTNNRFVVHANTGNVGIGMMPIGRLSVNAGFDCDGIQIKNSATNAATRILMQDHDGGTANIDCFDTDYWNATFANSLGVIARNNKRIVFSTSSDGNIGPVKMTIASNGNIGIGCSPRSDCKLAVKGKITCGELQVIDTSGWADYVFEDGYPLMPLNILEQKVKTEKHLPGVPSASEVAKNGVNVSQMQSKLLEKVEELTLYMIQLKKENDQMKKENERLTQRLMVLEKRVN